MKESLLVDIEMALSLLTNSEIKGDLGEQRSLSFASDLSKLKTALLEGNHDNFDENKIKYFRGPAPYYDTYKSETHELFAVTLKILNGLSLLRIKE